MLPTVGWSVREWSLTRARTHITAAWMFIWWQIKSHMNDSNISLSSFGNGKIDKLCFYLHLTLNMRLPFRIVSSVAFFLREGKKKENIFDFLFHCVCSCFRTWFECVVVGCFSICRIFLSAAFLIRRTMTRYGLYVEDIEDRCFHLDDFEIAFCSRCDIAWSEA